MKDDEKCTIKNVRLLEVSPDASYGTFEIPGVGRRRFHQSGIHDDSEVYWTKTKGVLKREDGPGKLVLNGWYAEKVGMELD